MVVAKKVKVAKKGVVSKKVKLAESVDSSSSKKLSISRNILFFGLGILLLVVLFFWLRGSSDVVVKDYSVYNGYEFSQDPIIPGVWGTTVNLRGEERFLEFRGHPLDLEDYEFDPEVNQYFFLTQLGNGVVFIAFSEGVLETKSGYVSLAGYELARGLRNFMGFNVEVAKVDEVVGLEDYPLVNCELANINELVFVLNIGEPGVRVISPFCLELSFFEPETSVDLASLVTYKLLGVMD